jgi:hypothetical protein
MKDWLHGLLKVVDYERGKVVGFLLAILVVASIIGCPIQTRSPISGNLVTENQWVIEVQDTEQELILEKADIEAHLTAYNAMVKLLADQEEAVAADFAEKAAIQQKVLEIVGGVATTLASGGAVAWPGVLSSIIALGSMGLAAGGMYDSKRKNAIIAEEKAKVPTA